MIHTKAKSTPRFTRRFLEVAGASTTLMSAVLMTLHSPSLAAYTRPDNARTPSTATSTSGSRNGGIMNAQGLSLTPLAPQQHVGRTQSTHPTFTWYVPTEVPLPGEFQIYELIETPGSPDTFQSVLQTPQTFVSTPGMMSLTLPAELEGLRPNTNYVWQVLLRYGDTPSEMTLVRAQIETAAAESSAENVAGESMSSSQPTASPLADHSVTQAQQLAEAGYWYDAFALGLNTPNEAGSLIRETLLLELAALEAEMETEKQQTSTLSSEENLAGERPEATDSNTAQATPLSTTDVDARSHSEALQQIAN